MNFRQQIVAKFAAKPSSGPSLEEAVKINDERLSRKRASLAARISKLIYSLSETDCNHPAF